MTETWRPIPGWEGFYEVSDLGRVKSCARSVPGRPGVLIVKRERLLKPMTTRIGHRTVALCRDNRRTTRGVHRLVLLAFVGPAPDGTECCHNDGDPANNVLSNLRWDTHQSNMVDKVIHGQHHNAIKAECIHGHPFDEANTYFAPSRPGHRMCRACVQQRKRDLRERQRSAA